MSHSMMSLFEQLFSGLLKKEKKRKKEKMEREKKLIFPYPKALSELLKSLILGVLKESIILVCIPPNTHSNMFYRYTTVQFYNSYKMLKDRKNKKNNSIYLLNRKVTGS